ncbi:MAG: LysM peptidoglycan-binding domain-containing protein [Candidatus Latescibacterota bacterium]|nr:LysM peptidoglycan-binding domain-containing protein [Candidatus Latescibacterota bacterium]
MKNLLLCGLALCVLASLVGPVNAQGKKITRDEYTAQMADLVQREAEAQTQITSLKARIAELEAQASSLDKAINNLNRETLALVGATQRQVDAFSRRLESITSQLEGLRALAPEVLVQKRKEVEAIKSEVSILRSQPIAALPEIAVKITNIFNLLGEIGSRIDQPVTIDYSVRRGDNLWNISKKSNVYDDPYMWPRIYRANRDEIKDPDLIYPKQNLAIPFGVAANEHLVERGHTLFKIAAEVYNDASKWHKIYQANQQQVVEPHLIFPAQVLQIPSN